MATETIAFSSFQKADRRYEGIYAHLTMAMARQVVRLGGELINFEQDLGIEGLRSSKLSWHPVDMLKKYSVGLPPTV